MVATERGGDGFPWLRVEGRGRGVCRDLVSTLEPHFGPETTLSASFHGIHFKKLTCINLSFVGGGGGLGRWGGGHMGYVWSQTDCFMRFRLS